MDATLSAPLVAKVLDDVRDVGVGRRDPGALEPLVEHPAGGADERVALDVLAVAGLLPDQHHARLARAFAHHRLRRALVQVAGAARLDRAAAAFAEGRALGDRRRRVRSAHCALDYPRDEAGTRRLQRLDVRRLARPALPERADQAALARAYAERFDTVEVNSTFYRLARREAVAGWVRRPPPGFLFAVKASRYLTHVKRLVGIEEGIKRFYEPLEPLIRADRLGPVLWQLPENFHRDDARLTGLARRCCRDGLHTIEFRHPSWFVPGGDGAAPRVRVALTIGDHPTRPFQTHEATTVWRFIRFHYGSRGRNGNYSPTEVAEWARRIVAAGADATRCTRTSTTTGRGSRRPTPELLLRDLGSG